jgi:hypothetical protein
MESDIGIKHGIQNSRRRTWRFLKWKKLIEEGYCWSV